MEKRAFGDTGLEVSVLGFGGAEIGFENASDADVERLLHAAIDAGLNVIDTAECYADSEEKIGRAVSGRRDEFHLFTKCGHSSGLDGEDWDPRMLAESIDRSLRRLQTDRVDLVQLHSCDLERLQQGDAIDVLRRAKEAGKTRLIGYSGDNEASAYAVRTGVFDTLQTSLNVADQAALDTAETAVQRGMGVIAKRPIANAAYLKEPAPDAYGRPYWERLQRLAYPAMDISLALRWTLAQPVHVAIVGTKNPDRWAQNAALLEEPLPIEAVEAISARWREAAGPDWAGLT